MPKAIAQITIRDENDIDVGSTVPINPVKDQMWLDTSVNPSVLKRYNGSSWDIVNDVQVGGRNYILNGKGDSQSGFFKNFNKVEDGYGEHTLTSKKQYSNLDISSGFLLGCRDYEVGKTVVFSYDVMYTKWDFPEGTNIGEFWIGQRYTNSTTSNDGAWRRVTAHDLPIVGIDGCKLNEWFHVERVLIVPSKADQSIGTASSVQFYNSNADIEASVTFRIKDVKVEYGNKATDWTPAPEDFEEKIQSNTTAITVAQGQISGIISENTIVKGDITSLNDKYTSINATVDGINATVASQSTIISNLDDKVTTVETKQATLEQNLDGFKTTVSNTYSTKTEHNELSGTVTNIQQRVNTVEQSITASAITTTISSAINSGASSISTTQFIMDITGLTIKNGALKIQNNAGANVLYSDINGNLTVAGTFINKTSTGLDAIKIDSTNIYFYDWERNGRELGIIYSSYLLDYPNCRGFSLAHNSEGYMTLGYRKPDGKLASYMVFDKYYQNPAYTSAIRVIENTIFNQTLKLDGRLFVPNTILFEGGITATTPMIFKNTGDSRNILCAQVSVNAVNDGFMVQGHSGGILFSVIAGRSYTITQTSTQVSGNFTVTGSKNSLQVTKSYGERLINAYETAEYYFGDIGSGVIKNGECTIWIDDIFRECVNTDVEYHVFTQIYNGGISSIERYKNYFMVYGEDNTSFSWELKAKRLGYENIRLDKPDIEGYLDSTPVFTDEDSKVNTVEDLLIEELEFDLENLLMEVL